MAEAAIIQRLLADGAVSALVSDRIEPGRRNQGTAFPAIVVNWVDGAPVYTDDGETNLQQSRIEIDCWADTYSGAKDLAAAVKASLSAFQGVSSGVTFQNVLLDAERDLSEGGGGAVDYPFRVNLDFIFWYQI